MEWPTLYLKMEQGVFTTFAPVIHGTGYFMIPMILQAYDYGCRLGCAAEQGLTFVLQVLLVRLIQLIQVLLVELIAVIQFDR
jgi:hypothetical protein